MDYPELKANRDKEKLKSKVSEEIKNFYKGILDYGELIVDSKDRYKVFRSRVLKLGNGAIEDIFKQIDLYYNVEYVPRHEDVIKVNKK